MPTSAGRFLSRTRFFLELLRKDSKGVAWRFVVNAIAGSVGCPRVVRILIYRLAGIDVHGMPIVQHGVDVRTPLLSIGERVYINVGVLLENVALVTLKDDSGLASGVLLTTATHEISDSTVRAGATSFLPITIGEGSWVGSRAVVLAGVTIGKGCLIAAGAVVTRDCEPDGLYAGVPARRIRDLPTEAGSAGSATDPSERARALRSAAS